MNDGSLGYICPQATPGWYAAAIAGLPDKGAAIPPGPPTQQESEDCLFLDVIAPAQLFNNGGSQSSGSLAPVLFNIHGGGNFMGEKKAMYWPGGLLERSNNSFIYVSVNYRVSIRHICSMA